MAWPAWFGAAGRVAGRRVAPVVARPMRVNFSSTPRASADAKHAGNERLACMLMAPGPLSWVAGATESRSPVGAEPNLDPEVAPHAVGAFEEAHWAARLQARKTNAFSSLTR